MKSAVVYYSYSGNTNRVAHLIIEVLKHKGEEAIPVRIRPLKDETNFFLQCRDAFLGRKPDIYRTLLDLRDFDRIILGSPVWAFKPAPAVNTYLETCASLQGKTAVCFVTYGSGTGRERTLGIMRKMLEAKGAHVVGKISFQQDEDADECRKKIEKIL
jgi:flavodoxin